MAMANNTGAPIYDSLIEERGDVLAQVRQVAEQAKRTAAEALEWGWPGSMGQRPHTHPTHRGNG